MCSHGDVAYRGDLLGPWWVSISFYYAPISVTLLFWYRYDNPYFVQH